MDVYSFIEIFNRSMLTQITQATVKLPKQQNCTQFSGILGEDKKLEPDGTEVELASTFRVIVLRTAKIELSHNNY